MFNSDHIEVSIAKIRTIFERASERIEALKPGEKIPATQLAETIGSEVGLTGPQLYPTLRFLFDGYPGILVRRGAHGGLIKPDLSQPTKKAKLASNTTTESDSDSVSTDGV